jgi:hypothetical protein
MTDGEEHKLNSHQRGMEGSRSSQKMENREDDLLGTMISFKKKPIKENHRLNLR